MNREEINTYIAEQIMGECAGKWRSKMSKHSGGPCLICGHPKQPSHSKGLPDYCSDSSPRSWLNEVVAFVTATPKGWNHLFSAITVQIDGQQQHIQANAEQIARACVEAHRSAAIGDGNE